MITFREFLDLVEGKKKEEIKRLAHAYLAGRQQSTPQVVDYGDSAPNSPERAAQIKQMMKSQGGGAIHKAQKQQMKQATKTAKKIMKKND